jgi:WD40 repeat protein
MNTTNIRFYVTGGTLAQDAPSYMERQADRDLFEALLRGDFCYVLTSRQMGKSSLMVRTAARLRQEGITVVRLDLQGIGQNLSPEEWYDGLLDRLGRQLQLTDALEQSWQGNERLGPLQRWMTALREVVLARLPGRLVIFVDEIDVVRGLPFSTDEFFAGIRECYNRRSEDPAYARLAFCLLGVATPADLISDTRISPFNIGRRIELTDFTAAEAAPLAQGLLTSPPAPPRSGAGRKSSQAPPPRLGKAGRGSRVLAAERTAAGAGPRARLGREADSGPTPRTSGGVGTLGRPPGGGRGQLLLERVLYWTGGHPYLTQRLCRAVAEDPEAASPADVDRLCAGLFLTRKAREVDDNLVFVRNRLLNSEVELASLLELYRQVQRGKPVEEDETNPLASVLRLSGVVRAEGGTLRVRNRIYEGVFDQEWIQAQMPDAELRRQRAAYRRGLARASAIAGVVVALVAVLAFSAIRSAEERQKALVGARHQLYAAQMHLAQQAGDDGNIWRTRELLAAQRPRPGQEDLRGFEWRYLWRLCRDQSLYTFRDRQGYGIQCVAISPDGKILAAASNGGAITLWDVARRRELAILWGHQEGEGARSVAFSPDGTTLASGGGDSTIRLWNVRSLQEVAILRGHPRVVEHVVFSPDGRMLASGGRPDGTVILWNLATRRVIAALPGPSNDRPSVAFSPDGKLLAATSGDKSVKLWDLRSRRVLATLRGHRDLVVFVGFSPDGRTLVTTSADHQAKLWDVASGREIGTLYGHKRWVSSAAFSPDGRTIATSCVDGTLKLWDLGTQEELATLTGHAAWVNNVVFCPDGKRLASASDDQTVKLWDLPSSSDTTLHRGHRNEITTLAFSPNSRMLASGSLDATVRLWDLSAEGAVSILRGHPGGVGEVAFAPDGKLLASWDDAGKVGLWDVASLRGSALGARQSASTRAKEHRLSLSPAERRTNRNIRLWDVVAHAVVGMGFSPDSRTLATSCLDGTIRLWDLAAQKQRAVLKGGTASPASIALSPNGKVLASEQEAGVLGLWDMPTGRRIASLQEHAGKDLRLAFSPDGQLLVCVEPDTRTLALWDVATRRARGGLLGHTGQVRALAFSADGRLLASGSEDKTVRLWDLTALREAACLQGHGGWVTSLAFAPDGRTLASSANDSTVRLWNLPTREEVAVLPGAPFTTVTFSPDGNALAAGGSDGILRLWRAASFAETDASAGARLPSPTSGRRAMVLGPVSPDTRRTRRD